MEHIEQISDTLARLWKDGEGCDPALRLAEIRELSNAIQAMQNLVAQCRNIPAFRPMTVLVQQNLDTARRRQLQKIHQV